MNIQFGRTALHQPQITQVVSDFVTKWNAGKQNFILQTSGSTGTPKKIAVSRRRLLASATATISYLSLQPQDKFLICLPTNFTGGLMMLVRGLVLPAQITVVEPSSDPFSEWKKTPPAFDFSAVVPLQLEAMLNRPRDINLLNKMKALLVGGAAISHSLEQKIKQQLTVPVYHTFGMTETVSHIALRLINGWQATDYFTTLPGITINKDQQDCLTIKGEITDNELLVTNDRVELLDNTKFKWLGRADFVINSGGIKIQPEVIEKVIIEQLNFSSLFYIAGQSDERLGEKVVLVLEQAISADTFQQIQQIVNEKLSKYHVPSSIIISQIQKTDSGKLKRSRLNG